MPPRRPYLWIAAAAVLVYGWAATFDYVMLDDDYLIKDNTAYLSNPANIVDAFAHGYFYVFDWHNDSYYRPFVTITYIVDTLIAPGSPRMGHVTNILLHAAVACLVMVLLGRIGVRRDIAFALALLFAVHPLATNAVGWIPGRNDLLLALFAIAAFIAGMDYLRTGSRRAALIAAAGFVCALLTKETAVALVPAIAAYALFGTADRVPRRRWLAIGAVAAAALAAWVGVRHAVLGAVDGMDMASRIGNAVGAAPVILQAFGKCVLPVSLSVLSVTSDTSYAWGGIAIVASLWLLWQRRGSRRLAGFGALWFLLFLAPSLVLKFEAIPTALECRIYLPLIGVLMVIGNIAMSYAGSLDAPRARVVLAVVIVVASVRTVTALSSYRNGMTFWEDAAQSSPSSALVHANLGSVYCTADRLADAERELRAAIALNPDLTMEHHSLGVVFFRRGQLDSAEREFQRELRISPAWDLAIGDMGALMYQRGNLGEALRYFRLSVTANPRYVRGWQSLALLYTGLDDRPNAAQCTARIVELGGAVPPKAAAFVNGR